MKPRHLSVALTNKIGPDAATDLVEFLDRETEHVLNLAAERFERRLTEQLSSLRVDIVRELHATRVDVFKWSFLFWIGQVAAMVGVLAFMMRGRP